MNSGGLKEARIRWGADASCKGAIIRGKGHARDTLPWAVQKWLNRSTWRIQLNYMSAVAMRPYVKLLS